MQLIATSFFFLFFFFFGGGGGLFLTNKKLAKQPCIFNVFWRLETL